MALSRRPPAGAMRIFLWMDDFGFIIDLAPPPPHPTPAKKETREQSTGPREHVSNGLINGRGVHDGDGVL